MTDVFNQIKQGVQAGIAEAHRLRSQAQTEISRSAQQNNVTSPLPSDFATEVTKASNILSNFTDPEKVEGGVANIIPKDVILNAKGLAIFTVFKAGFVWSGRVGSGVVVARLEDGTWSPPSCINIGGLGFGVQIGADFTDFIIILNTPEAVKTFSRGENITLGGNLSVAAGPVGLGGEVSGSVINPAALYSYSKCKGLFAGVSLEGTIIIERKDTNKQFYGKEVSAEQILTGKAEVSVELPSILYNVIKKAEQTPEPKPE